MGKVYYVKAIATIKLEGVAKIMDAEGQILRTENLGDVGEFTVPVESVLPIPKDGQCGVGFTLEDIFRPFNV